MTKKELEDFKELFRNEMSDAIKPHMKKLDKIEDQLIERLEAIEAELGIEFTPERKKYSYYEHCYGQISDHPIHTGYPVYKTIPQEIERPLVSITDKMKALLKHLGIKDIRKIDYPAKTEIKVIKKGLPTRAKE